MSNTVKIVDNYEKNFINFRKDTFEIIKQKHDFDYKLHAPITQSKLNTVKNLLTVIYSSIFGKRQLFILFTLSSIILTPFLVLTGHKVIAFYPGLGRIFRGVYSKTFIAKVMRPYARLCAYLATNVITLSPSDENLLNLTRQIEVFPSEGVDTSQFTFKPRNEIKTIGFVGRLIIDKGILDFLELAESLKHENLHFVIYGDSADNDEIKEKIAQADKDKIIEYRGYAPKADFLQAVDLMILPSAYGEGFPITVLECVSAGINCVVYESHWTDMIADSGIVLSSQSSLLHDVTKLCLETKDSLTTRVTKSFKNILPQHEQSNIVKRWEAILSNLNQLG